MGQEGNKGEEYELGKCQEGLKGINEEESVSAPYLIWFLDLSVPPPPPQGAAGASPDPVLGRGSSVTVVARSRFILFLLSPLWLPGPEAWAPPYATSDIISSLHPPSPSTCSPFYWGRQAWIYYPLLPRPSQS